MENFVDSQHGIATLLASLIIILALHLVLAIGKILWELLRNKNETLEKKIQKLIDDGQSNNAKVKTDLRRIFNVLRHLAGDDWQKFRKIMDDDLET